MKVDIEKLLINTSSLPVKEAADAIRKEIIAKIDKTENSGYAVRAISEIRAMFEDGND